MNAWIQVKSKPEKKLPGACWDVEFIDKKNKQVIL